MRDINTLTVSGNLTRDPEIKTLPTGTQLVSLRLAVNGSRKQGDEYVDRPSFFDVEVIGGQGNVFAAMRERVGSLKGHRVFISGELEQQEWQQNGATRSRVVIKVAGGGRVVYDGAPRGRRTPASAGAVPDDPPAPAGASGPATADDIPY